MAEKKKDEAIANPQTNAGPRYPYAAVLWQGANHRMVFDDTPQNAKDTSGGQAKYDTQPGGGVMHISGKDGSRMEFSSISGRFSVMATGQVHQAGGKGMTSHFEGTMDERTNGDNRSQTKGEKMSLGGEGGFESKGGQQISTSEGTKTTGTNKDSHSIGSGDSSSSSDGNTNSQQRGDRVDMVKGTNIRVTEGEDAKYVISGNASTVYDSSFKTHVEKDNTSNTGGKQTEYSKGAMLFESAESITFKVGQDHIIIDSSGIHIKHKEDVRIGGDGEVNVKSGINKVTPDWVGGAKEPK